MSTKTTTRQQKTPRQRAENALGVAQRAVARFTTMRDKLASDLKGAEGLLAAAERRLEYVSANPDLKADDPEQLTLDDVEAGGDA